MTTLTRTTPAAVILEVEQYCARTAKIADFLGVVVEAKPLVGGLVNDVFLVQGSRDKLLVKRSGPTFSSALDVPIDLVRSFT